VFSESTHESTRVSGSRTEQRANFVGGTGHRLGVPVRSVSQGLPIWIVREENYHAYMVEDSSVYEQTGQRDNQRAYVVENY
jgi:hypothetical protein